MAGVIFNSSFDHAQTGWNVWEGGEWNGVEGATTASIVRSTEQQRSGTHSAKFTINDDDALVSGSIRAELTDYYGKMDDPSAERWYGLSIFLPTSYVTDPCEEQLFQWHGQNSVDLDGVSMANSPLAMRTKNGHWEWGMKFGGAFDLGAYTTNAWTDWVIHVKFSPTGTNGLIEIWKNGVKVLTRTGKNTYNDVVGNYFKIGIYKYGWPAGYPTTTTTRTLYYDNIKTGDATASYSAVNPGSNMITSTLDYAKLEFNTPGPKQVIVKVKANGLTVEQVVNVVINPKPVTPPSAPDGIGYAYYLGETTGGAGGDTVVVKTFAALKTALNASAPKVIVVEGQLNGGGPTKDFGIFGQASNKTIIGMPGAIINGFGLWFVNKANIVIKNLIFKNMPAFPAGASLRDYILFEGTTRYLVDNCDLYKGDGTDGCIDSVKNADLGTIMNCYFYGSSRASMSGYHTDPDKARLTYYGNHFVNCLERSPSYGGSTDGGHVINNFYEHVNFTPGTYKGYGIATRGGGTIVRTDNNSFKNFAGNPLVSTIKSYDADGVEEPAAQFSGIATNLRVNSGNNKLVTLTEPSNPVPYDYSDYLLPAADVENYVRANAGAKMTAVQVTDYIASL